MLIIFPLVFGVAACGVLALVGFLGRRGAMRFGGLVGIFAAIPLMLALAGAAWIVVGTAPHLDARDDYERMASWAVVLATSLTAVTSLVSTVVVLVETIRSIQAHGSVLVDPSGLGASILRGVVTVLWTMLSIVVLSLAVVLPPQWIYGDAPPPWVQQLGGLALIGGTVTVFILGVRGRLPGTKKRVAAWRGR